jgi:predicted transcriptional regulator of viral defense system
MPPTRYDQFYEAVRRVGDDAYLTAEAVLALHGLASVNPRRIRVGTRQRVRRTLPDWIEVVKEDSDDEDLISFEGIPTTTIVAAFRACRERVMSDRLRAAVPVARTAGLLSEEESGDLLAELAG